MKIKQVFSISFFIGIIFSLISCNCDKVVNIAISKASPNYDKWLLASDSSLKINNLYYLSIDSAIIVLKTCDALLLTGGEDIYPAYYAMEADTAFCDEFDIRRDSLELALLKTALSLKMPVFGICRGLQLINTGLGGTLYSDIPSQYTSTIEHRMEDYTKCFHDVEVTSGSDLHKILQKNKGTVNSNHHQGILTIAPELIISARAPDGFPEAIEWNNPEGKSFLMAVQWHPERLSEHKDFSIPLAEEFIKQAKEYKKNK